MKTTTRQEQDEAADLWISVLCPGGTAPLLALCHWSTHLSNPLWPTRKAAITKLYHISYSLMFPSSRPLPTSFPLFLELSPQLRFSRCVFTCSHKASLSDNRVTCAPFLYALAPGVVRYFPFRLSSASQMLSILGRLDCSTYPKAPGKGQGAGKEWSLVPHPLDDSHVSGLHTTFPCALGLTVSHSPASSTQSLLSSLIGSTHNQKESPGDGDKCHPLLLSSASLRGLWPQIPPLFN